MRYKIIDRDKRLLRMEVGYRIRWVMNILPLKASIVGMDSVRPDLAMLGGVKKVMGTRVDRRRRRDSIRRGEAWSRVFEPTVDILIEDNISRE